MTDADFGAAGSIRNRTKLGILLNDYVHQATHASSVPAPRIKAYRAAAGLEPTSEMGHSRRFDHRHVTSGLPRLTDVPEVSRHVSNVPILEVANLKLRKVPRKSLSIAIALDCNSLRWVSSIRSF